MLRLSKARSAERRLERLAEVDKPWEPWRLKLAFPRGERAGDLVAELAGAVVGRGSFRLGPVDLDLRWGERLAVTGPNGAGKSTLAMTLAGLIEPAAGTLEAMPPLAGGLGPHPARWRSRELLTRIGMVFQEPEHQLLTARVRDELAVGPRALRLDDAAVAARVDPLLDRLRLRRLAAVNPFTLSGGEKRRLTVAAALATRPRMLVLDEPTYGQDARTWRELADLIDEVRDAGTALVLVTHDRDLVDALADDELRIGGVPVPGASR